MVWIRVFVIFCNFYISNKPHTTHCRKLEGQTEKYKEEIRTTHNPLCPQRKPPFTFGRFSYVRLSFCSWDSCHLALLCQSFSAPYVSPSLSPTSMHQRLGFPDFHQAICAQVLLIHVNDPPQGPSSWPQPSSLGHALNNPPLTSQPQASLKAQHAHLPTQLPHSLTSQRPLAHSLFCCSVSTLLASSSPNLHHKVEHLKASSVVQVRDEKCRELGPG